MQGSSSVNRYCRAIELSRLHSSFQINQDAMTKTSINKVSGHLEPTILV